MGFDGWMGGGSGGMPGSEVGRLQIPVWIELRRGTREGFGAAGVAVAVGEGGV